MCWNKNPSLDWVTLNHNQILTTRQTKFLISKSIKNKVGLNILPNRLLILNGMIPLTWLNYTMDTYKVHIKKLLLSTWIPGILKIFLWNNEIDNGIVCLLFNPWPVAQIYKVHTKRNDLIKKRIFSFLETFRNKMINRQYGYPETSQNRPKFGERKCRFQFLCL